MSEYWIRRTELYRMSLASLASIIRRRCEALLSQSLPLPAIDWPQRLTPRTRPRKAKVTSESKPPRSRRSLHSIRNQQSRTTKALTHSATTSNSLSRLGLWYLELVCTHILLRSHSSYRVYKIYGLQPRLVDVDVFSHFQLSSRDYIGFQNQGG